MKKQLRADEQALLRQLILSRCPDLVGSFESLSSRLLTTDERETIREALVDELTATGLHDDFEPIERGKRLEDLIDTVWHLSQEQS